MLRKDELKPERAMRPTADAGEIARFDRLAEEWWRPDGQFNVVHRFNRARVGWIRDTIAAHFDRDARTTQAEAGRPLAGLTLLDVGCGAGLVAEPMRRLGAAVTAIDASERNIVVASRHAGQSGLDIDYRQALPEALVVEQQRFDVVLSLEVVEHVADVKTFLGSCASLVVPGGLLIVGTLNRTLKSYALAIVGAEYVLGWLPRGTHAWSKFVTPDELARHLLPHGLAATDGTGVVLDPLAGEWRLSRDTSVNYLRAFTTKRAV